MDLKSGGFLMGEKYNSVVSYKPNLTYALSKENVIESPLKMDYLEVPSASQCSGCRSCGGGCYGCKVTEDMLEAKLD